MANIVDVILRVKSQGEAAIQSVQQRFASLGVALVRRREELEKFNNSMRKGDQVLQQLVGGVSLIFGVQALRRYAEEAKEADRAQAQLNQSLKRAGETSAAPALNAQADALERVTEFSDEAIKGLQQLLVTFGLSGKQTQELTESVLDFAQATGQSAESASQAVARMLLGDKDTLGRYNIKLDTTKGKVDALGEALRKTFSGAARGAVADPAQRALDVDFGNATKDIGRVFRSVATPVLQELLPVLQAIAARLQEMAPTIRSVGAAFGEFAAKVGPVILAAIAFNAVVRALMIPINLLRSAIFLLAGQSFLELNANLAKSGGLVKAFGANITTLAGAGRIAAGFISVIGAAFAGWQLGKWINEIEVAGTKITDWVAAFFAAIASVWAEVAGWFKERWEKITFDVTKAWRGIQNVITNRIKEIKIEILTFLSWIAEKFNNQLGKKLGFQIPTDGLKESLAAARTELAKAYADNESASKKADEEHLARLATIQSETKARAALYNETVADMLKGDTPAKAPAGPVADPGASTSTRPNLNDQRFGDSEKDRNRRADYEAETAILQARLAGNQVLVDQLTRARERQQDLNDLGEEAVDIVEARLDVTEKLQAKERARTNEEIVFAQRMGEIDIKRADIEASRLITQQVKQRQVNELLIEQNRLISEKLAMNESALKAGTTEEDRTRLLQEIASLRKQVAENRRAQEGNRELTLAEGVQSGFTTFIDSLGTAADNAARVVSGTLNSALEGTSDILYNLTTGVMTWKDAWQTAILDVGRSFLRMVTDMVAKMVWKNTIEKALTVVGVATHVAGEQAKTAATTVGFGARMVTVAKEAIAYVYQGAVKAYSAMASIPYVGPFIGAAVMAAAIAAGIGLVSKIGHKEGGFTATGPADKPAGIVHAGEWVAPKWMVENPRFQPVISMLEGIRTGQPGFAAGGFVPQLTAPAFVPPSQSGVVSSSGEPRESSEGRPLNLTLVDSRREAKRIQWNSSTEDQIVEIVRRNRARVMT